MSLKRDNLSLEGKQRADRRLYGPASKSAKKRKGLRNVDGPSLDRGRAFAIEYCKDYNARSAAIRVGRKDLSAEQLELHARGELPLGGYANLQTAANAATQYLDNPEVRKYVRSYQRMQLRNSFISNERIKQEIAKIAFSNIFDYLKPSKDGFFIDFEDVKDLDGACVQSVESTQNGIKIKLYSKVDSLRQLALMHGMYEQDNCQKRPIIVIGENGAEEGSDKDSNDE